MVFLASLLAASVTLGAPQSDWPTLRQALQKHGIDAGAFDDADRIIWNYQTHPDADWFAIAYYWTEGTRLLPELRIRTLNRKTGVWRHTVIDEAVHQGGGATGVSRAAGVIYVDLHITPSAGALIVLSERLAFMKRLAGWSSLLLPDGRMLYENNMTHFAPAHPGSVSLYDPRTGHDVRVYPAKADRLRGRRLIDRSIVSVKRQRRDSIQITAIEQDIEVDRMNRGIPSGPARNLSITCDVSQPTPKCGVRRVASRSIKQP